MFIVVNTVYLYGYVNVQYSQYIYTSIWLQMFKKKKIHIYIYMVTNGRKSIHIYI